MKKQINQFWQTSDLTRNALIVALVVACIVVAGVFRVGRLFAYLLASGCIYVVFIEYGELAAWLHYLVVTGILWLLPLWHVSIFYTGLYGLYPVLAMSLSKRVDRQTAYWVRIIYACVAYSLLNLLMFKFVGRVTLAFKILTLPIHLLLGIVWIFFYDQLMTWISRFYQQTLRQHFIRKF